MSFDLTERMDSGWLRQIVIQCESAIEDEELIRTGRALASLLHVDKPHGIHDVGRDLIYLQSSSALDKASRHQLQSKKLALPLHPQTQVCPVLRIEHQTNGLRNWALSVNYFPH